MTSNDKDHLKLYYSIGEVSELLNTTTSQLRFWEGEFDVLKVRKNKKGDRLFTIEDIQTLKLIQHLLKEKGYTIEGAKNQLKSNGNELSNQYKVLESLRKIRTFLTELSSEL